MLTKLCHILCSHRNIFLKYFTWKPSIQTSSQNLNGRQIHDASVHLIIMRGECNDADIAQT